MASGTDLARTAAENAARQSYSKLVAFLAARSRDVAAAEDALAEAFALALEKWPVSGVPEKPEAWLMTVAHRRGIDAARRRRTGEAAQDHLALLAEEMEGAMGEHEIPDERLRLMFACAHPAIEASVRAPLILQTVLGLDAATIASAFLVSPATMGQRLVRAKQRIRDAGIPFRVPERHEFPERLDAVLGAIYAAFAEGWGDATGTGSGRHALASEGLWLGRLAAALMPDEPEALGLLALMLFAQARRPARRDADGDFVPLSWQDMRLWDHDLIDEAEALLTRAGMMGRPGRYQFEAAIQSAHCARRASGRTDWAAIRDLYGALHALTGSPVVAVNRAVAIGEAGDPAAGLGLLDSLDGDGRVPGYQPYWAARAHLLSMLGKEGEADEAFEQAIGMERDEAARAFLKSRRLALRTTH